MEAFTENFDAFQQPFAGSMMQAIQLAGAKGR